MSVKNYIIGTAYGSPISYDIDGVRLNAGIHNMFIDMFYGVGVFGTITFICLQIFLILKLRELVNVEKDIMKKSFFVILLLTLICYQLNFLAWSGDSLYPIVVGISISLIANHKYDPITYD